MPDHSLRTLPIITSVICADKLTQNKGGGGRRGIEGTTEEKGVHVPSSSS